LDALIRVLDRDASLAQIDGRFAEAESLAVRAAWKPDETYALIEARWPGPYFKLFTRYRRAGRSQWPDTAEAGAR
jgi:hypothetical protein